MRTTLFAVAAAVLLAACPGNRQEDESQTGPAKTSTTTVSPRTPASTTALPSTAAPVTEVQLLDYEIRIADTLPAGPQHLRIANGGHEPHGFAIEGPGVSTQLANNITRGDTTELAVTLKPGTYTVWCPVDGQRGKGLERTITVKGVLCPVCCVLCARRTQDTARRTSLTNTPAPAKTSPDTPFLPTTASRLRLPPPVAAIL